VVNLVIRKTSDLKFIVSVVDFDTLDPVHIDKLEATWYQKPVPVKIDNPGIAEITMSPDTRDELRLNISAKGYLDKLFRSAWDTPWNSADYLEVRMMKPATLKGRVVDADSGAALDGVTVDCKDPKISARTDKLGEFRFPAKFSRGAIYLDLEKKPDYPSQQAKLFIKNGAANDAGDIPIHKGGTATVKVVKGKDEIPMPGIMVILNKNYPTRRAEQITDSDGIAVFTGPQASGHITVSAPELKIENREEWTLTRPDNRMIVLHVGTCAVKGTVRHNGQPAAAKISTLRKSVTSADDGTYTIDDLPPGECDITASLSNPARAVQTHHVTLVDNHTAALDFDLLDTSVKVHVTDEQVLPVFPANIYYDAPDSHMNGYTDADGNAEIKYLKPGQSYNFYASADNPPRFSEAKTVQIPETGGETNVNLVIKQYEASAHFLVLSDDDGKPVENASIRINSHRTVAGPFEQSDTSKATTGDGVVDFTGLPAGDYNYGIWAPNYADKFGQFHLESKQNMKITERLQLQTTSLAVFVNGDYDRRLSNAQCTMTSQKGQVLRPLLAFNGMIYSSDVYYFTDLTPGTWRLQVSAPGYNPSTTQVNMNQTSSDSLSVMLTPIKS
jgi:hypothetical protein